MVEFIFILLGICAFVGGIASDPNITWLIWAGIILMAIGGVWFLFLGDEDFDFFN